MQAISKGFWVWVCSKYTPLNALHVPLTVFILVVAPYDGPGKLLSENILTNGCSCMNCAAARFIYKELGQDKLLATIQCCIAGTKRLPLLNMKDEVPQPIVQVQDLQIKIQLDTLDESRLILDLV